MSSKNIRSAIVALAVVVAALVAFPDAASASDRDGDSRPCVTSREFNRIGGLHQTRRDVARIVDTRGVRVSNHAFDGWNADAGVAPADEYGAPIRHRQIRRYPLCAETATAFGYGVRFVFVEFWIRADGTTRRVEQSRVG